MPKALITTVPFADKDPLPLQLLKKAGIDYLINPIGRKLKEDELADMLGMVAEILGFHDAVKSTPGSQNGHYVRTPYAYQPKLGRKYVPPMHIDFGQGLIQLIDELSSKQQTQSYVG